MNVKKNGLILMNKKRSNPHAAFDDSESDDGGSLNEVDRVRKITRQREKEGIAAARTTKIDITEIAVEKQKPVSKQPVKKSRYIENLLSSAEKRKKQREVALQVRQAKQVEKDKEKYGETLSFTTSAYKEFKEQQQVDYLKTDESVEEKQESMKLGMTKVYSDVLKKRIQN